MTCHDAADYFIWHARHNGDPLDLDKLQALLYFAQVWYVAFEGVFLFEEDFYAHECGPVIPEIRDRLQANAADLTVLEITCPLLKGDAKNHLEDIVQGFWDYDSNAMTTMVKREEPWVDAYGLAQETHFFNTVIPKDHIRQHYTQIMEYDGADDRSPAIHYGDTLEEIIQSAKEALEMPAYMKDMAFWIIIKKAEKALHGETEEAE